MITISFLLTFDKNNPFIYHNICKIKGLFLKRKYITYLNHWIKSKRRKPLLLRGARQVGKSTLVRLFAEQHQFDLMEINLERHVSLDTVFATLNIDVIRRQLEGVLKRSIVGKNKVLFLDEIQATPHALAALRYFYEEMPDLPVIAAGSLLDFVLADHEFSMPVGRIEYLHIQPMSFEEYLQARGQDWLCEQMEDYKIGSLWPQASHDELSLYLRDYMLSGGMPEVVANQIDEPQTEHWQTIQENINQTIRDDFNKYAKKRRVTLLHQVFDRLPHYIGKKLKYSELAPNERSDQVRDVIYLFTMARILHRVFHSHADGVPLGAQTDEKVSKCYWLDIGLLNRLQGVHFQRGLTDTKLFHEGVLAEQFIAQHLVSFQGPTLNPSLYYWLREGKSSNAEVDFLVQNGSNIVPIEVKAKKAGALKSLLQFIALRKSSLAVKFSMEYPSLQEVTHRVTSSDDPQSVTFELLTLPLYFVEQLPRILQENSNNSFDT